MEQRFIHGWMTLHACCLIHLRISSHCHWPFADVTFSMSFQRFQCDFNVLFPAALLALADKTRQFTRRLLLLQNVSFYPFPKQK
jgi:hypothetical protein